MNHYPTELTVPPIPVVALIYLQELHPAITKSLSSETTGAIRVLSFSNETSCFEKKKVSLFLLILSYTRVSRKEILQIINQKELLNEDG